jgi:lipid-A-disaccharide synthase
MNSSIFVFAGEQSGDAIGAHLVHLLKNQHYRCYGVGGKKMESAGLEIVLSIEHFQIMGFFQVLKNLPKVLYYFQKVQNIILKTNPSLVLFIDYPGFSLKMASTLRKKGFKGKIVQYVCPSIWAWKKKRKKILEDHFDLLFSLFAFEKNHFNQSSLPVLWCGHPFALKESSLPSSTHLIIYPGSRKSVIEMNLEIQLQAADILKKELNIPIGISCSRPQLFELIERFNQGRFPIYQNQEEKDLTKLAIATSGTITLELALKGIPAVVTYNLKMLDAWIAKYVFKLNLPFYCIVNIVSEKEVYKEIIGINIVPHQIVEAAKIALKTPIDQQGFKDKVFNPQHDTIFIQGVTGLLS